MFWVTDVFGFDSSSNFVFFCGILVLLARLFTQDLKVAMRKRKLTTLTQTEALKEHGGGRKRCISRLFLTTSGDAPLKSRLRLRFNSRVLSIGRNIAALAQLIEVPVDLLPDSSGTKHKRSQVLAN